MLQLHVHLQSSVQAQLDFLQLHLEPHPFSLLQLHFISSIHAQVAIRLVIQTGHQLPQLSAFATLALDSFLDFNRQSQIFGLQRFTVVLYSKGSTLEHVDELRKELFVVISNSWKICHLQLMHYFNMQDVHAAYQASIWTTSHRTRQQIPAATSWGWKWMWFKV